MFGQVRAQVGGTGSAIMQVSQLLPLLPTPIFFFYPVVLKEQHRAETIACHCSLSCATVVIMSLLSRRTTFHSLKCLFQISIKFIQGQSRIISMITKYTTLVLLIRSPRYSGQFGPVPNVTIIVRFYCILLSILLTGCLGVNVFRCRQR